MKKKIFSFFTMVGLTALWAGGIHFNTTAAAQSSAPKGRVNYELWDKVLDAYVNDKGLVNYRALKENTQPLDAFINQLRNADPDKLSETEKKAFWINAYNAITMHVVVDKYPVGDIRFINFGLVWKIPRPVAGGKYSLGHIEHEILRPMGDPRIHFAINCASLGCPVLPKDPFYPETLDEQLDQAAKDFINNPEKVRLDREENTLYYSAIFNWFEEDFLEAAPGIKKYIMQYINTEDKKYLAEHEVRMNVLDYDWSLNEQGK